MGLFMISGTLLGVCIGFFVKFYRCVDRRHKASMSLSFLNNMLNNCRGRFFSLVFFDNSKLLIDLNVVKLQLCIGSIVSLVLFGKGKFLMLSTHSWSDMFSVQMNISQKNYIYCETNFSHSESSLEKKAGMSLLYFSYCVRLQYRTHFYTACLTFSSGISKICSSVLHCGLLSFSSLSTTVLNSSIIQLNSLHTISIRQMRCSTRSYFTHLNGYGGFVMLNGLLSLGKFAQASCA